MLGRRSFLHLLVSGTALAGALPSSFLSAFAQTWRTPSGGAGAAFADLAGRAASASGGRLAVRGVVTDDYAELFPRLLDLIDSVSEEAKSGRSAQAQEILGDAAELLGAITAEERMPEVDAELEEDGRAVKAPAYEVLKDDYLALFNSCQIRPERAEGVKTIVRAMLNPERRTQYEDVEKRVSIPWYFVGITHSLEAGFNFKAHLHNGDPLRAKTFQVPANRPEPWNPPDDWASSAIDALTLKKYNLVTDWSLPRLLYSFEKYNGFGNRKRHDENGKPINTPYLWSFSQHYSRGKYVRDGVWSQTAVSKQCGAAVLLKELLAQDAIALPESG